ncbi:MAG: phosphoesterase [Flavobacteriaceae bacterium]|nr:MAG: phosphoesterase [Flavobacteriaceae bacterium]
MKWILLIIVLGCIDLYAFQSVKTLFKNPIIWKMYWLVNIAVICFFLLRLYTYDSSNVKSSLYFTYAVGLIVISIVPKLLISVTMLLEDVTRLAMGLFHYFSNENPASFMPGRRAFASKIALGLASIPFVSILYGITKGKYNYQIVKHSLYFDDLPAAFDGFSITHISDVHSGSFDNADKIAHGMELINEQQSDMICFTGDLVNNVAEEMDPWIGHFKSLKAPFGKFSILGNHDYGEYVKWNSSEEKEANFAEIKAVHPKIGFNLLLNEHVSIEKDGEKIELIGVENWGVRFKKAGDLPKASKEVADNAFKIVMSHDPSHWDHEIKAHPSKYHLTLSGHTHGMQFGIDIPGFKWSPVQYVYKRWAGIYEAAGRYINVNRGFGFLAFPGRVGIWPEISVITLRKKVG